MDEEFKELEEEIFDSFMERNPIMATNFGIHEYDDTLGDLDREKHEKDIELLDEWNSRLEDIDPNQLSEENRFARKLGLHIFDLFSFRLKELRQWEQNPSLPMAVGGGIQPLLQREFAPFEERLESIISRIEDVPRVVEQEKTKLDDPVKLWVDMAIESAEQLPMLFKLVMMIAKENDVGKEQMMELSSAADAADEALEDHIQWLKKKKAEAKEDYTIGEEKFEELLERRELGFDSEEILDIGEDLLDKYSEGMEKYASEIDPDASVKEAVEQVMSKTPDSFEEAITWYEEGLQDAKEFIEEHDLATIPDDEETDVIHTPEYLRHMIPYAAYMGPAKFEEIKKGIYMVTPPDDEEDLKNYSYWDVRNTTVHEGYPGHHLQLSALTKNDDVFRLFSHSTETVEGWAHYCEEMMKEQGFDDTPEARLIQMKDARWRAARIIVDVKLSTGRMSFDEAVDYMVDKAGLERADALAEVKRYTQNPSYQLSYLLGKKLIMELKEDVKQRMGDDFTEKFFHDTILYAGSVPFKYLKEMFDRKIEER